MAETRWRIVIAQTIQRGRSYPPGVQTAIITLIVAVLAGGLRLAGLAGLTPGFRTGEATTALLAQRVGRDNLPILFGQEQDALPPFFPYMVKLTGSLAGWDIVGVRLAAAICGIAAATFCTLWLARAMGPIWSLAGGLLAATSFWQIMFSRQAIEPVSSAMFSALGLWLTWIALEHGSKQQLKRFFRRTDLAWYLAAGAVFGLGFFTHASYLVVPPLILLSAGVYALNQQREQSDADVLGPALLLLAMVVAMTPLASHFLDYPDDFRRSLDLAAGLPEDLTDTGNDVVAGIRGIFWRGTDDPAANLPGRAILDPIIAVWAAIGLLAAIRHPTRALEGTLLIWTVLGVFAIGLIGGDDPSLYFTLMPVFVGLPVLGMRAAWQLTRQRQDLVRIAAAGTISVSILVSSSWAIYDYFWQWSDSHETYVAMRGDVRDAVEALDDLPEDDIPAYVVAGDADRIIRYLAPDRIHHRIDGRDQISIPSDDDAYLVAPRSTQPVAQLRANLAEADLVESAAGPGGEIAYRIWLAGPRTRDILPYAVPAIPFANGWTLSGFDARAGLTRVGEQPRIEVVLLWGAPSDADPFIAEVRLEPAGVDAAEPATSGATAVVPWKAPEIVGSELLLVYLELPFPEGADSTASLQVGLRDPSTGDLVTPLLNEEDDGYAFLNELQIVLP